MFGDVDVDTPQPDRVEIHHPDWAAGRVVYLAPVKSFPVAQGARIAALTRKSERKMVTVEGKDGQPLRDKQGDLVYVPLIEDAVHDEKIYWDYIFQHMVLGWNFTQKSKDPAKDGKPLPFAEPWKSKLYAEYGMWLAGEIEQLAGGVAGSATTFRARQAVPAADPTGPDGHRRGGKRSAHAPAAAGTAAAGAAVETLSAQPG